MNERTAVLFLVLCITALLGLIELEKVFEDEKIAKKERQIAEIKKQKEDQKKAVWDPEMKTDILNLNW